MTRLNLLAAVLLLLAGGMLALSFYPRGGTTAVAEAPTAIATADLAALGRTLFAAKGCTGCHRHDGLTFKSGGRSHLNAPDLTRYDPDPAFVREWLRDPQAVRPGTAMPNLGLSGDEIEALLAFLEE